MNVPHIDKPPREAVLSLLRMIAHHERCARGAEEKDLDASLRYHEASGKDAAELLALCEKRWPEEAAVARLKHTEAIAAEAGNHLLEDAAEAVMPDAERGSSPFLRRRRVPF
jgi:hypothetical protein